jgi:hypothetical protein
VKRQYYWREWFGQEPGADGKVRFVLVRGEHYACSQSAIIAQLRVAAAHCGFSVRAVDMDDRVCVSARRREEPAACPA